MSTLDRCHASLNFGMLLFLLQVLSYFARKEQSLYATPGAIASEVLSAVRTVVAFGGEFKEHERCM